jgi:hypothetical protein
MTFYPQSYPLRATLDDDSTWLVVGWWEADGPPSRAPEPLPLVVAEGDQTFVRPGLLDVAGRIVVYEVAAGWVAIGSKTLAPNPTDPTRENAP